jgi:type IV pilus assembly protein PilA
LYNKNTKRNLGKKTYIRGGKQMLKNIKKRLKNQRGVTLVELLAVVVILGIIAAIAVPNIGGIIDKTKKDAHVANAQQMADAARLYVLGEKVTNFPAAGTDITLFDLVDQGYLENMSNPSGGIYAITDNTTAGSFVNIKKGANGAYTYTVTLRGSGTTTGTTIHFVGDPFDTTPAPTATL